MRLFDTFTLGFVTAFAWMGLLYIGGMRITLWRCPNCGETFSATKWYSLGFSLAAVYIAGYRNVATPRLQHPTQARHLGESGFPAAES